MDETGRIILRWRDDLRLLHVLTFCILSAVIVALGVQGFEHGRVNNFRDQSIQLPLVYSYADSTLYADDFLMEARDSYVTWFYPAIGFMSRYVPLQPLMFALYLLATIITVGAVYALAETIFPRRNVGLFAVILWMAYFPNPGGDYVHSPFVTHSTFAIALALWAIVLILRKNQIAAAILLGLIANINAMTAFFVVFMWGFAVVISPQQWSWKLLRLPIYMGIAAAPVLIWRFSLPLAQASLDQFVSIIELRLWYAVFPFRITAELWLGFFLLAAIWVYSYRYAKKNSVLHPQVLRLVSGIIFLAFAATIFSEIIPIEFIIELQLIRSTWLINLFILLYLANMIRELLSANKVRATWLAFGLIAALATPRFILGFFPVSHPTPYLLHADFETAWIRDNLLLVTPMMILGGVGIMIAVRSMIHSPDTICGYATSRRIQAWFACSVMFFVAPLFMDSNVNSKQVALARDWEQTLTWVAQNTEVDAKFVTPPTLDGFRVGAKRTQLADWKDGTVGIFDNEWAIDWYELMLELGFDEKTFTFKDLSQGQLCHLSQKYDLDYAVVFRDWGIEGEAVYQNDQLAVIPIESLVCTAT